LTEVNHPETGSETKVRKSLSKTPSTELLTKSQLKKNETKKDLITRKMDTHKQSTSVLVNDQDPLQDEDIMKIDRLQLINASARYQLLSANQ